MAEEAIETVQTVFGPPKETRRIPTITGDGVAALINDMGWEKDKQKRAEVIQDYVNIVNLPTVAKQGDAKWHIALRILTSKYTSVFAAPDTAELRFLLLSTPNRAWQDKQRGTWGMKTFGLVRSVDPKKPLEGPASVTVNGFSSEQHAKTFLSTLRAGAVYPIKAQMGKSSPTGILGEGQSAFMFVDAGSGFGQSEPDGSAAFGDPWAVLERIYPVTRISQLLLKPEQNATYRVEGDILYDRTVVDKDGVQGGSLVIADDSMDPGMRKQFDGGLRFYLPREEAAVALLPTGSRVAALVSGYERKAQQGQQTLPGEKRFAWNALAVKVLFDVSGGTSVPEPGKAAVRIPQAAAGLKVDDLGG